VAGVHGVFLTGSKGFVLLVTFKVNGSEVHCPFEDNECLGFDVMAMEGAFPTGVDQEEFGAVERVVLEPDFTAPCFFDLMVLGKIFQVHMPSIGGGLQM
jgi:hypothetical protein